LKDLETKVEDLEKESESANHENGLLRAQVERLQVELREYRKRLSWVNSGNGISPSLGSFANGANARSHSGLNNNDFNFEFPKFGDLPGAHIFNNGSLAKSQNNAKPQRSQTSPNPTTNYRNPGAAVPQKDIRQNSRPTNFSGGNSPVTDGQLFDDRKARGNNALSADNLNGFFGGSSHTNFSSPRNSLSQTTGTGTERSSVSGYRSQPYGASTVSNTDSPSASSESQQTHLSSIGTSPEPTFNSPSAGKPNELGLNTISEEKSGRGGIEGEKTFCDKLGEACGNIKNPVPVAMSTSNNGDVRAPGQTYPTGNEFDGFDWFAQQNGGQFDPVLFGEYRDSQDAVLSQDFGTFFDDAFPLPELPTPFNDANSPQLAKKEPIIKPDEDEEVVPGEDKTKMMTCTKIWFVSPTSLTCRLKSTYFVLENFSNLDYFL
jgi:AP-1-like factor